MSRYSPSGLHNIIADQGATFSYTVTWKDSKRTPINVTGYTARMHVRSSKTASTTILVLTTENGRISVSSPTNGEFTLTVSATDMAAILEDRYVYDLEIIAPITGIVTRLIYGNFVVRAEITR